MVTVVNNAPGLAINSQSLDGLRAQAQADPDKALRSASQQFEAVFLNMMLKSMREATPQDGVFDSEQTKMFTGMLDQQLAQEMANNRSIGLADIMVRQLGNHNIVPAESLRSQPGSSVNPASTNPASLTHPADGIAKPDAKPKPAATPAVKPAVTPSAVPSAYNESTQQDFVRRMTPHALKASQATGVPSQLMLGQAALESGWGRREIRMADGSSSHNLFGIKATGDWKGKVASVTTTEYRNGVARKEVQKFRAYDSYQDAFNDYANLLGNNSRYAPALQPGLDNAATARAIQRGGYATDPNYADKLARVMGEINIKA